MSAPVDFEEHDFSLLDKEAARQKTLSRANFAFKAGAGALLAGAGVGLAAFGISYAITPKIIETTKVVTETKIERVEIPKIVEVPKVVEVPKIVETTKVVEKAAPPAPANQPSPAPEPGQPMTKQDFQNTKMFREATKCKGVLVSHIRGVMTFADGSTCRDAMADGSHDPRLTTTRNDGESVVCNDTGRRFSNGKPQWLCYALHNGKVEAVPSYREAATNPRDAESDDPFGDLF